MTDEKDSLRSLLDNFLKQALKGVQEDGIKGVQQVVKDSGELQIKEYAVPSHLEDAVSFVVSSSVSKLVAIVPGSNGLPSMEDMKTSITISHGLSSLMYNIWRAGYKEGMEKALLTIGKG